MHVLFVCLAERPNALQQIPEELNILPKFNFRKIALTQSGGERGQNVAKVGERLIEAACQSARPNIIKLNELGSDRPELAKHGERGAGGSRTHDGGFASRWLSG